MSGFQRQYLLFTCVVAALGGCTGSIGTLGSDPALFARYRDGANPAILAEILLGDPRAGSTLAVWLDENPQASAESRSISLALLCEDHFRHSRYREALDTCDKADKARGKPFTQSIRNLIEPLRELQPPRWASRGAMIPLFKDRDGVRRLHVGQASAPIEAVLDTGAEISVIQASIARQLGVRSAGAASLGTTTSPVAGGVGVIPSLQIGETALFDLPVVVLPDEQLRFPDGGSIPMVLGLPALIEARRFAVSKHGGELVIGAAVRLPRKQASSPIYWDPSGMGMLAAFARGKRAVHFDSGSGRTYLFPSAMSALSGREVATRRSMERTIGGLGGTRREQASRLDSVEFNLAKQRWRIAPIEVAESDEHGEAARIGAALFDRFENVTVDFTTMRMWLED